MFNSLERPAQLQHSAFLEHVSRLERGHEPEAAVFRQC